MSVSPRPEGPRPAPWPDLASSLRGEVRLTHHDRMLYATDASLYQVEPVAVVIPRDQDDLRTTIEFCHEHGLPVLPRGGGTSLAGQTVNRAVVIDCSVHLNRIVDIDVPARRVVVEPGVVLGHLNAAIAEHGLMFGPDVATAAHANIGGMIGNNSAGAHSILYGRTVDHVESLDVLLADGRQLHLSEGASATDVVVAELTRRVTAVITPLADEIRQRYPRVVRRVNGYNLDLLLDQIAASSGLDDALDRVNLAHLICGSEGTLGTIASATLRLVDVPLKKGLLIAAYDSIDTALADLPAILATNPAAVEMIDDTIIQLARANREYRAYVDLLPGGSGDHRGAAGAVLYVEYFGNDEAEIQHCFDEVSPQLSAFAIERCLDPVRMESAWRLRKAGEPLLHALPGTRKPITFVEDLAVAPDHLLAFVRAFRSLITRYGTRAAFYAHASVGCLHIRPLVDLRNPDDVQMMQAIARDATQLVIEYGGALSGEHGDGRVRSHLLEQFYGRTICDGFRQIKTLFDPDRRMNPGNIVDPVAMDVGWRVRPDDTVVTIPDTDTYFRFDDLHGFAAAVDQCNGAGVCRRTTGGTMCPSYRALRDERHSTRGRGNALRLAITGQFHADGSPAWDDADTMETLDLCLSCKACKTECPSNVDISRLKAEFLAQQDDRTGGPSLRRRMMGSVRPMFRAGSVLRAIANPLMQRGLAKRMLGIDARRSIPPSARPFRRGYQRRDERPAVILFVDCFSRYQEPAVAESAVQVLEAFGYRVLTPDVGCCGRGLISQGLLPRATSICSATAGAMASMLAEENPVAILGLEPSCVSAITDDWPDLRLTMDRAIVDRVAEVTLLWENFIEQRWDSHPARPSLNVDADTHQVVLHGHCHHQALWGIHGIGDLMRRCAGDQVTVLGGGCCGMAGAFGYAPHRYDLSMAIGELALLPAVRTADAAGATVVATGTSCRHQIRDGAGVEALHPVQFIAKLLLQQGRGR